MTNYVAGLAFNTTRDRVVLIEKRKPVWQAGKLNGVGGKTEEGETPEEAMAREFEEETGVSHHAWEPFAILTGYRGEDIDFRVHFFRALLGTEKFKQSADYGSRANHQAPRGARCGCSLASPAEGQEPAPPDVVGAGRERPRPPRSPLRDSGGPLVTDPAPTPDQERVNAITARLATAKDQTPGWTFALTDLLHADIPWLLAENTRLVEQLHAAERMAAARKRLADFGYCMKCEAEVAARDAVIEKAREAVLALRETPGTRDWESVTWRSREEARRILSASPVSVLRERDTEVAAKAWWEGVTAQWEHRPVGNRVLETENPYRNGKEVDA